MTKVALLIGVSEYEAGLNPLPAAVRDVEGLREVLIHPEMGGFAAADVTVLQNPERLQMEEAIYRLFADRQKEDLLLLYFSGHGLVTEQGKFFFSTRKTRKEQEKLIPTTAVDCTVVHEWMEQSRSRRQVVILDSCFSGAFAKRLTAQVSSIVDLQRYLGGEGRAILTASSSTQYVFEPSGSKFSLYTRYLIEGIRTGAAGNSEGEITVAQLHQYVKDKVQKAAPMITPELYSFKDAYTIKLARAPQDDPRLRYRKEVESRVDQGRFSIPARRLLNLLRSQLNLSTEIAEAIEAEVLQPFLGFRRNLQEYEQTLKETLEIEGKLSERSCRDLYDYQIYLGLRQEDVADIQARLIPFGQLELIPSELVAPSLNQAIQIQPFEFETAKLELIRETSSSGDEQVNEQVRVEIQRSRGRAESFLEDLCGIALEMVAIPGGQFKMGSDESDAEKPIHPVTVQPFCMGKFPITQAQYQAVMRKNPSSSQGANRPVENVSWHDALKFCGLLSQKTGRTYRLPSEAEWEYACRAGTQTPFCFGETITTKLANYDGRYIYASGPRGRYRAQTTEVGSFPANAIGLYDMHGNVWEWCLDHWHETYTGAPTDGTAWVDENEERVVRGGSWIYYPGVCRSAYRNHYPPDLRADSLGFRVVCSVPRVL